MRILLAFLFIVASPLFAADPIAVYLTIQEKPDTQMTVCWVLSGAANKQLLKYREATSDQWFQVEVDPLKFPEKFPYTLFITELHELKPEARYEFILPESEKLYAFKTLPSTLNRPVKFVAGGDIYHDDISNVETMNIVAAAQNPDFALLGGDIAYSGSKFIFFSEEGGRWIQFLKTWSNTMKRADGTLIPLITAIGNHDINGRYGQSASNATFYYFLFPTHQSTGYQVIDFGNYLSLWVLDSGHAEPVNGKQAEWLEKTMQARQDIPFRLAIYHVPAYPSARSYDNDRSAAVRKFWVPIFEKYGLKAAYENHDHAYKRTQLLKGGQVSNEGILYVGDGAWGVDFPRLPKTPQQLWYLAFSAQKRHVVLTTIFGNQLTIEGVSSSGEIFDTFKM